MLIVYTIFFPIYCLIHARVNTFVVFARLFTLNEWSLSSIVEEKVQFPLSLGNLIIENLI